MHHIRRSAISTRSRWCGVLKSQNVSWSLLESNTAKPVFDVGSSTFSSSAIEPTAIQNSAKRLAAALKSGFARPYTADVNHTIKDVLGPNGISFRSPFQLMENHGKNTMSPSFSRSFASRASRQSGQTPSESKKDVATVEDPFDAPTYNIPEKPVTFTEGASYSVIILAGLAVATAAGYAVFKELIFEPKEYKIFNKALKRIQDDSQVRVRIGSPITGYGQESRNRAARQRIPNKIYTDENGVERVEVNFYIRGPHGAGKVFAEMFKDNEDKQWKYTYLIVEILSPSPQQLILESYLPA